LGAPGATNSHQPVALHRLDQAGAYSGGGAKRAAVTPQISWAIA